MVCIKTIFGNYTVSVSDKNVNSNLLIYEAGRMLSLFIFTLLCYTKNMYVKMMRSQEAEDDWLHKRNDRGNIRR